MSVLPVAPWLTVSLLVVALVAVNVPPPAGRPAPLRAAGSPFAAARVGAVGLVLAAVLVAVALRGPGSVVDNPVPALVLGLGWPLLLVLPALAAAGGRRSRRGRDEASGPQDVRPAVVAAAAVLAYLALAPSPTDPRSLGVALGSYALALLALGIALGAGAVARADVLGLLGRWTALGPSLVRWHPPRGAAAVLAVVLAGTWVERAQRTSAWFERAPGTGDRIGLVVVAGVLAALAAAALTAWADGRAAPVLLPLAAAAVVGSVLRRALISGQLLWDAVGPGAPGVAADPLGVAGGQVASLGVVVLGGALASAVLARRVDGGPARLPGAAVVLGVTGVSGYLVLTP